MSSCISLSLWNSSIFISMITLKIKIMWVFLMTKNEREIIFIFLMAQTLIFSLESWVFYFLKLVFSPRYTNKLKTGLICQTKVIFYSRNIQQSNAFELSIKESLLFEYIYHTDMIEFWRIFVKCLRSCRRNECKNVIFFWDVLESRERSEGDESICSLYEISLPGVQNVQKIT